MAMAASSVDGLSLDPPALLLCVNQGASLATPLSNGAPFAVNVLGSQHSSLPMRCCAPWRGEERFTDGRWSDWDDVPILEDAQASFLCVPDDIHSYGTHFIVIGRILKVTSSDQVAPMIFADGGLHRLSEQGAISAPKSA